MQHSQVTGKKGVEEGTWSSLMSHLAHCENKKMNSRVYSSKDLNLIGILS